MLIDMNSFFASVHQALNPAIRGKPVIVCGDPQKRHGVVLAASYEAKGPYGIKTGMTVNEAKKLCPHGIFVSPCFKHYVDFSTRTMNILRDFSPLVEPYSIDEAFVDITGSIGLFGSPREIALKMKRRIKEELGITCSIGIGPNKLLAKMASEFEKPNGLSSITMEEVPKKIWPLPVRRLYGVGSRYEKHFQRLNIKTIGDLAKFPADVLKLKFGLMGEIFHLSANGLDYSPVEPGNANYIKSIGNQITLPRDYVGLNEIKVVILELAEQVCFRARNVNYAGKTVSLTLKNTDFASKTHALTLEQPTNITNEVYRGALKLLKQHWNEHIKVRLVGLSLSNLTTAGQQQLNIFNNMLKQEKLEKACDGIKKRFGYNAIKRAVSLTDLGVYYEHKQNKTLLS